MNGCMTERTSAVGAHWTSRQLRRANARGCVGDRESAADTPPPGPTIEALTRGCYSYPASAHQHSVLTSVATWCRLGPAPAPHGRCSDAAPSPLGRRSYRLGAARAPLWRRLGAARERSTHAGRSRIFTTITMAACAQRLRHTSGDASMEHHLGFRVLCKVASAARPAGMAAGVISG